MQIIQKLALLLFFAFICNIALSQQKVDQTLWHLTVADSATAEGIDNATITLGNKKQLNTNGRGVILIDKHSIDLKGTIHISCIGYKTKLFSSAINRTYPDTIQLAPCITPLQTVNITPFQSQAITVGEIKHSHKVHFTTIPDCLYVQFIPNDKKIKGTITTVNYVLNNRLHGIEMPFRVRLFKKGKDSVTLDQELTRDSITVYNPEKKQRLSVDVSKYNIQFLDSGVMAIFEILSPYYYPKDSVWCHNEQFIRTPGIDMYYKEDCGIKHASFFDHELIIRRGPYSMVDPEADHWNRGGIRDHWSIFKDPLN